MNIFARFFGSLFNLEFYKREAFNQDWPAFGGQFALICLISIVIGGTLGFNLFEDLAGKVKLTDFEGFTIEDGQLQGDYSKAQVMLTTSAKLGTDELRSWIILCEDEAQAKELLPADFGTLDTAYIFNRKQLIIHTTSNPKDSAIPLSSLNSAYGDPLVVNKSKLYKLIGLFKQFLQTAYLAIVAVTIPIGLLIFVALASLLARSIASIIGWKVPSYSRVFRAGVFAATMPKLLADIGMLTMHSLGPNPALGAFQWAVTVGLLIFALNHFGKSKSEEPEYIPPT